MDNTPEQVAEYLASIDVEVSPGYNKTHNRDGWECDEFNVHIKSGKGSFDTDFSTGTGHRVTYNKRKPVLRRLRKLYPCKQYYPSLVYRISGEEELAVKPDQASIIHALLMDSQAGDTSYNNWCEDWGYDNDSMKAFKVYQECCKTYEGLRLVFTGDQLRELTTLLEDY